MFIARPLRQSRLGLRAKSSISALAYKALHRNEIKPRLPTIESPDWSTSSAISSILYDTPVVKKETKAHILQCLVQNEPGVLSRVAGCLAARGFNIDSLVVSSTEVEDLSRMTIVLQGQPGIVEQARRQIEDLVPVWAVLDYSDTPVIRRELLLAKISLLGPEYFAEIVQHHKNAKDVALGEAGGTVGRNFPVKDYHPENLAESEALRHKHQHLDAITKLAGHYGGKVVDVSDRNCVVELCATPEKVSYFLHHAKPFGILEVVRTGTTALATTPLDVDQEEIEEALEEPDQLGDLPPG